MRISLVGAFNLADGYLGAAKALRKLGHEVLFVPAYMYRSEFPETHVDLIAKDLEEQNPDVILWWRAETLKASELGLMRKKFKQGFAFFSWDDPYQWEDPINQIDKKCPFLDVVFTCCQGSRAMYKRFGAKQVFYCLPGFDKEIHYPDYDENYKCDISLVCTNLYDKIQTREPHISRRALIDKILEQIPGVDLRLYGPAGFSEIYPQHYRGWVPFDQSRKVFSSSKINLNSHICPYAFMYLNERTTQILGSGGLLFVDAVNGIDKIFKNNECVVMDPNNFTDQLKHILFNYAPYEEMRKRGLEKALQDLSWDSWAKTVTEGIV